MTHATPHRPPETPTEIEVTDRRTWTDLRVKALDARDGTNRACIALDDGSGAAVAWVDKSGWRDHAELRRRIVACVNALAGIPTEELEAVISTDRRVQRLLCLANVARSAADHVEPTLTPRDAVADIFDGFLDGLGVPPLKEEGKPAPGLDPAFPPRPAAPPVSPGKSSFDPTRLTPCDPRHLSPRDP